MLQFTAMKKETSRQELAKAVVKTMNILESLSHRESVGVTELSHSLGMHKSTVYRFLSSLRELGYVRQDGETERYTLTLKLFEIGSTVLDRLELWREAYPVIKDAAELTKETLHLAVLDGIKLVYLGKIESTQALRVSMMSRVGQNAPTYCTGVGKVLIAYLQPARLEEVLQQERLDRYTKNTITSKSALKKELRAIREQGYAIDDEEHELGVRCIAAPIRDNAGNVCAACSISMPSVRLTDDVLPRYRDIVLQAASDISGRLGYNGSAENNPAATGITVS